MTSLGYATVVVQLDTTFGGSTLDRRVLDLALLLADKNSINSSLKAILLLMRSDPV